jgi:succinate-semialdehyde dehydrogenase/glutarate-semialdehyde dehydrogenase
VEAKQMYIGGEWVDALDKKTVSIVNPGTLNELATIPYGGKYEAVAAVNHASKAFKEWKRTTAYERAQYMQRFYELIIQHKDELGELMTKEQGKPLHEATGEVVYAANFIQWYAEEAKRVYGETIPSSTSNKRIFVYKQPVGVIAAITPWNFPAAMITRKIGPALAAGCTCIIKPATQTPLTAIRLVELAEEAGFPPGVINIVTGASAEIADALLEDTRVAKITFTGSTEVGKLIMRKAAETVKKISLELGGHAPVLVFDDADIDLAVKQTILSKFRNMGQTCICANRVYVHESIREKFEKRFAEETAKLKVGYGLEDGVSIGPLIDKNAMIKVEQHVQDAVNQGAKILTGGKVWTTDQHSGYYYEPTVLSGVKENMLIMNEETFGPVAPILGFSTDEEAVRMANNTRFGLAAYMFTKNIDRAIRVSEDLEYGIVGLNDGGPSAVQAPFGGFKESGIGREGGHYGMDEYLEVKFVSLGLSGQ